MQLLNFHNVYQNTPHDLFDAFMTGRLAQIFPSKTHGYGKDHGRLIGANSPRTLPPLRGKTGLADGGDNKPIANHISNVFFPTPYKKTKSKCRDKNQFTIEREF